MSKLFHFRLSSFTVTQQMYSYIYFFLTQYIFASHLIDSCGLHNSDISPLPFCVTAQCKKRVLSIHTVDDSEHTLINKSYNYKCSTFCDLFKVNNSHDHDNNNNNKKTTYYILLV